MIFVSIALPLGHICAYTSSYSRLLACTLFLSGRSRPPTRNCSFSVCADFTGLCKYVSFLYLRLTLPYISAARVFSDFISFLNASPSFLSVLPANSALYFPKSSAYMTYSWVPPTYFHTFAVTLCHLIPARPFVTFPVQLYQLWLASLFGM